MSKTVKTKAKAKAKAKVEPKKVEVETKAKAKAKVEPKKVEVEAKAKAKAKAKVEPKKVEVEAKAKAKAKAKVEPKKVEVEAKAKVKAKAKVEPKKVEVEDKAEEKVEVAKPLGKKAAPKMVEPTPEEKAATMDFAYAFAEQRKREQRKRDEAEDARSPLIRLTRRPTTRAKGADTLKFSDADLADFKRRLLQLRQAAVGQSVSLKNVALEQAGERSSEDEDGSDVFLRLQNLSQVDSKNRIVHKIDEALHRIAEGSYGVCEVCGQLIRKPRLINMPFVHTCMECQNALESPRGSGR